MIRPTKWKVTFVHSTVTSAIFFCPWDIFFHHQKRLRVVTLGWLESVVLCSLYSVNTLNLGEIARGLLGLLDKWIGRRRICAGYIGRNSRLQYGRKRRSGNGELASA
jgi:hypothetical protein